MVHRPPTGDDERVSMRTLVVDDQPSFCEWARAWLETVGFEVVGCEGSGESALEAARVLRPELVLLDIQLPDLDGFQVAARLARLSDPPIVILISARDAPDHGRHLRDAPVRGFIQKADLSMTTLDLLVGSPG